MSVLPTFTLTTRKIITLIITCVLSISVYGQGYFNNWYFGNGAGLDFNSGSPIPVSGSMNAEEGCASISDYSGNLLFYTNGATVWDANHAIMSNGTALSGHVSSTQSALILPNPGNADQYYIFTTTQWGGSFTYSMVDMTLAGGLGAVTSTKNVVLHTTSTERVTAVCLPDGTGFWVIGHETENNVFFAYKLTAAGLSSAPVLSSIGSDHLSYANYAGQLKSSHSGNKLAVAILSFDLFEIFDFNRSSGVVSNVITFPSAYPIPYGVEFSPDDSRLYVGGGAVSSSYIYQVDMNAGNNAAIINSSTLVATSLTLVRSLQMGPDSKIYVAKYGQSALDVINNPNALGAMSDYAESQVLLASATSSLGLPNNYNICCSEPVVDLGNDTTICQGEIVTLNAGPATSYLWSNGSTASSITVSSPGTYWVKSSNGPCSNSDTLNLIISSCEIDVDIELPNVFTPNNDGVNGSFIPIKYNGISKANLIIYNRWGEEIFYSENLMLGWNGTYKNKSCSEGTYFWIVKYTTITNESKELKGFLTLIK